MFSTKAVIFFCISVANRLADDHNRTSLILKQHNFLNLSHDTQTQNKSRINLSELDEIWLFGYGSLMYKVDFPILAQEPAILHGWQRRFWQGSHDHRGTEIAPGRVLTLIKEDKADCFGLAFRITEEQFEYLDHREKNGYLRYLEPLHFLNGEIKHGVIYIAPEDNEAFLGKDSEENIARHIAQSRGPSGENSDYVFELARALREYNAVDEHVFAIEQYLLDQPGDER